MRRSDEGASMIHPMTPRRDDRRLRRGAAFPLRRLTAPMRALPDFFVAGAMKCGTSSLFHYLRQHPRMVGPVRKELHHFDHGSHHGRDFGWYRAHFSMRAALRGRVTGEATPDYMYGPAVPALLAAMVPMARIVVVLRDPVARPISHYGHEVRMGREYLSLEEAISAGEARLAAARAAGPAGRETWMHACCKSRVHYAERIARLSGVFPPDRILIIGGGLLFRDPEQATARVFDFLDLPRPTNAIAYAIKNGGGGTDVPEGVRDALATHFAPHEMRLTEMLGTPPDW